MLKEHTDEIIVAMSDRGSQNLVAGIVDLILSFLIFVSRGFQIYNAESGAMSRREKFELPFVSTSQYFWVTFGFPFVTDA